MIKVDTLSNDTGLRQRDRFLRVRLSPMLVALICHFSTKNAFE